VKVAQVIDCYTVAITKDQGSDIGVYENEVYAIGNEVIDPETGDSLGVYPRLHVVVTEVHPRFFVAETYRRVHPRLGERQEVAVNIGDEVRWISSNPS
jgi:hypothetical protein